jgi:hypothetical protein
MVKHSNSDKSKNSSTQAEAAMQNFCAPAELVPGSGSSKGAPPSNTAPANYVDDSTCIYRTGIDSIYLSWSGKLSEEYDEILSGLKDRAQSPKLNEQSQAILQLLDHRFEVSDKGRGRFPFVIRDNWFDIQISRRHATAMPLATAQIRSEVLSKSGYRLAVKKLELLISIIGEVNQQKISRIDICADFYTDYHLDVIRPIAWVMKALDYVVHHIGPKLSGFSFGMGGCLSGRLYDKYLEIQKSHKTFFYQLWQERGWLGELPVWRLEFQFRREVLREMGITSTNDLDKNLDGLWQYACQKWLRLTLPSNTDTAKTRWPEHPLWIALKNAHFNEQNVKPLHRTRKERLPSEEFLYVNGMGAFTSLMAAQGITELDEAVKTYLIGAQNYHRNRRESGHSLGTYVHAKAMQKARKFNTRLKPDPIDNDPEAYQKAKEGE